MAEWILASFINKNCEAFQEDDGKTRIEINDVVRRIYHAIFVNDYSGRQYCETLGEYQFDAQAKKFVLGASSMLSKFADFNI